MTKQEFLKRYKEENLVSGVRYGGTEGQVEATEKRLLKIGKHKMIKKKPSNLVR